jgi:poly(hydroxyalkanoate) granule-associated protein
MAKRKKDLQDELAEKAHQIWLAGLGAVAMAEEEGGKVFKGLVERGQDLEARGKVRVEKAREAVGGVKTVAESYWEVLGRTVDEQMTSVLHRIGVPTKDEIEGLTKKVDDLTASIEKLRRNEAARARTAKAKAETATE